MMISSGRDRDRVLARLFAGFAGAVVLAIVMMGGMGVAGASGSAPKLSTTVPPGGTATGASVASPGEFLGTLCGFSPLSPVNFSVVSVSGSAASEGSQIADQSGCVTFDGRVSDGRLSVNGSAPALIGYGLNDVIGSGNNSHNAHVFDTLRVPILRSGSTGLLGPAQTHIANIMALVVVCLCGLALLYLAFTFIRHRLSRRMRPFGPTV
jgi:hypothetical protein